MKIETGVGCEVFRPVTVSVTFESMNELLIIWGHLNPPLKTIRDLNKGCTKVVAAFDERINSPCTNPAYQLFNVIDDIVESRGGKY